MFIFGEYKECSCSMCVCIKELNEKPPVKITKEHKDLVGEVLSMFTLTLKELMKENLIDYKQRGLIPFNEKERKGMGSSQIAFAVGENKELFEIEHVKNKLNNEMPIFLSEIISSLKKLSKSKSIAFFEAQPIAESPETKDEDKDDVYSQSNCFCRVWLNFKKSSKDPFICIDVHIRKEKL